MLETPGMISATRWEDVHPKDNNRRKHVALYELGIDDMGKFDETLKEMGRKSEKRGRLNDLLIIDPPDVARIIYRQVMPIKKQN
jgi:hypothetical protein